MASSSWPVGSFFITNPDNPSGPAIDIQRFDQDGSVSALASFVLDGRFEGPPGHVHGGVTAAILDELMGQAVWMNDFLALLATMTNDYHLPVPLHTPLTAKAWVVRIDGRKIFTAGQICLPDGRPAVSSSGLYIHRPDFFKPA